MEFIDFLKEDKNTRKIFGKAEILIIEKQLKGINLTQSEKNRLSRDIRKKFEFIKKASIFEEEFELKKASENKKLIERIKNVVNSDELSPRILNIKLFGSLAENKVTFRSDIDISVEFDEINKKEALKFRLRILREFQNLDIQVYNFLPDKIKKEIDKKAKVIYERKNNR